MSNTLMGLKIAMLATDGVEQSELVEPRKALEAAGALTELLSTKLGKIKGWDKIEWGDSFYVDKLVTDAQVQDYVGLVLPGGVMNPDSLRINEDVISFVKHFYQSGKPIAAICHGPWTLIEAGVVSGKTMTSWPSLKTDLRNAGANWVNEQVVVDKGLITSRKPDDIPLFNSKMIDEFQETKHHHQFA